jgi:uncharacterized spore protein YtfJ
VLTLFTSEITSISLKQSYQQSFGKVADLGDTRVAEDGKGGDPMADSNDLIKTVVEEIERILSTKTVVGQSMTIEGITLIPLISVGFGFGAGAGGGKGGTKEKVEGEGSGSGGGGGGGVKPVAVIIVDKMGVRVEPIKSGISSVIESIGTTIPSAVEKFSEKVMDVLGEKLGKKGRAAETKE